MTHILLVEDDDALRQTVAMLLRREGFEVTEAADGVEGLRALYKLDPLPDCILLDLIMPRVNGQTFLVVKHRDPHLTNIPVIVYTAANADPRTLEGATLYLPKPIGSIQEITDAIMRVLVQHRDTLPPEE